MWTMDERKSCIRSWLSPRAAGELLPGAPTAQTLREWCVRGLVPGAYRTLTGRWQIPVSAIEELLGGEAA